MKKIEYWCSEYQTHQKIMVARIKRLKDLRGILFEIEIEKIFYQKGYDSWKAGDVTALADSDLREPREIIKFMFEEI